MQIKKTTVGISRKLNLGNYETKDFYLTAEAELESGETLVDVNNSLKKTLELQLDNWEMEMKGITPTIVTADVLAKQQPQEIVSQQTETLICPVCKELMQKKEGKDYYLCKKHWGYPAMIKKGQVRDRFQSQTQK